MHATQEAAIGDSIPCSTRRLSSPHLDRLWRRSRCNCTRNHGIRRLPLLLFLLPWRGRRAVQALNLALRSTYKVRGAWRRRNLCPFPARLETDAHRYVVPGRRHATQNPGVWTGCGPPQTPRPRDEEALKFGPPAVAVLQQLNELCARQGIEQAGMGLRVARRLHDHCCVGRHQTRWTKFLQGYQACLEPAINPAAYVTRPPSVPHSTFPANLSHR